MLSAFFRTMLFFPVLMWTSPLPVSSDSKEIKKTSLEIPADLEKVEFIRISLTPGADEIKVSSSGAFQVLDADGRSLFSGNSLAATRVKSGPAGIQFGPQVFSSNPITIVSETSGVKVDSRTYRHAVKIWKELNNKVSAVNEIQVEDYLKGVLPWESNPKWPMESLKAQAVAARTYAIFKSIENQDQRFVMSKDVLSQVYGGKTSENPVTNQAVELTRGQVLLYDGKIFSAYFHSTCAGATTHAEYLWNVEPHPALRGVACNFCTDSKHIRWSSDFTRQEIESKLRAKGIKLSGITAIDATDLDATRRARTFTITYAGGKKKIHSNDFRIWMDPAKFKSTLITDISINGDTFTFRGRGWGHGVGLCQYGMKGLAELGYSYKEILKYYFPGSDVEMLGKTSPPVSAAAVLAHPKSWWHKASELFSFSSD